MALPLSDYGKLSTASCDYTSIRPMGLDEVRACVMWARAEGQALRIRASGHSFNGAALPRPGEVLLRTDGLDHYRFDVPGILTAGAGAIVWDVRDFVSAHGASLPVYNGGWAGPTVGGFVCAGGIPTARVMTPPSSGPEGLGLETASRIAHAPALLTTSETHGGFWEHVASVVMVDGTGAVHEIESGDEVFPWLFGSFGQFGVFVEVRLNLIAAAGVAYPLGTAGVVPRVQADDPALNDRPPGPAGDRVTYWFSYLVEPEQEEAAWDELEALVRKHAPFIRPEGGWIGPAIGGEPIGYRYLVRCRTFHPPLVYPRSEDFVLLGVMATFFGVGTPGVNGRILGVGRDMAATANRRGFRLYPQAESVSRGLDYETYYGAKTLAEFARLKQRFDPDGIVNPGVVFPSPTSGHPRP